MVVEDVFCNGFLRVYGGFPGGFCGDGERGEKERWGRKVKINTSRG